MKTGLVMEGGALRTIFSAGVTDGFLERGICFPYMIGVSAGIAYGVSYLSGQFGRNLKILTEYAPDPRYMGARNMLLPGNRHCYFGLKFTYDEIPKKLVPFDYEACARSETECEGVVTDLETGNAVYLPFDPYEKDMKMLQATCAMPLLFPIYEIGGMKCMDGGVADAIPWRRALEKGCDRVVALPTKERGYVRKTESVQKLIDIRYRRYPKFVDAMRRRADVYNEDREALFRLEKEGRALIFCPDSIEGFSRIERDTEKIRALWAEGHRKALERENEVRDFLKG